MKREVNRFAVKKITEKRLVAVLLIFSFVAMYLLYNIFCLDFINHEYYKNKAYDQITTSSPLRAERGVIYDSSMNILAMTRTTWRIFVSTRDIRKATKSSGEDKAKLISFGLSSILGLDYDKLYTKFTSSNVLDVTVKSSADADEYEKVIKFVKENSLERLVFTEAQVSRYYPEGTFAAHVLGFTGSDNQGLYGLEYYYDDILKGEDGYYLYAKDANGNALDTEYSSYFPATDGYSIVTTLDSFVQTELESIVELIRKNHNVQNRVTAIVMNTETGAILGMATSSPFDPNSPFELDALSLDRLAASGFEEGSEAYKKYKNELLQTSWSNKAVSETYEPGSTFKIITVAAALELGVATPSDTFSCKGYTQIGGWRIKCHKTTGHGSGFSLAYGLQMSCNPTMIALSERIGSDNFYDYVEKFGYFEKTGIDLPSEASTIFHKKEGLGTVELATASFGQRFKVSIISQLTAISAVANGGKLVTPYLVEKIQDEDGNTVSTHRVESTQILSEEVARTVSEILTEGVSGDGGAKNAAVDGYNVAAKTGTSQKFDILDENGNSYLRIGSTVAYAPSDTNGISVIIVVDEPTSSVKYGSVVAAPYVSMLYEKILPYLEYPSSAKKINTKIENYIGQPLSAVTRSLNELGIAYEIVGGGSIITDQTPEASDKLTTSLSKVILYTEPHLPDTVTVPSLVGLDGYTAVLNATNAGLNIELAGISEEPTTSAYTTVEQSLPVGAVVKRGSVIRLTVIKTDFED